MGAPFLFVGGLLIVLSLLALINIGDIRLNSSLGILRDGLPFDHAAPPWDLQDVEGMRHRVPNGARWQLLAFTDHSLAEFPGVARALQGLSTKIEVLILSKGNDLVISHAAETARRLAPGVPVIRVSEDLYRRYKVRVIPFLCFVHPSGKIRSMGLPNAEEGVYHMYRLAGVIDPAPSAGTPNKAVDR